MAGTGTIALGVGGAGAFPTLGNGGGTEGQPAPLAKGGGGAAIVSERHKPQSQDLQF